LLRSRAVIRPPFVVTVVPVGAVFDQLGLADRGFDDVEVREKQRLSPLRKRDSAFARGFVLLAGGGLAGRVLCDAEGQSYVVGEAQRDDRGLTPVIEVHERAPIRDATEHATKLSSEVGL
jgi:hypothetical protein